MTKRRPNRKARRRAAADRITLLADGQTLDAVVFRWRDRLRILLGARLWVRHQVEVFQARSGGVGLRQTGQIAATEPVFRRRAFRRRIGVEASS